MAGENDSQATQLSQDNILPYYREQLLELVNPELQISAEARITINGFIQQINAATDPSDISAILYELMTSWRNHIYATNNDIILQIVNLWNTANNEAADHLHAEYYDLLAYLNQNPPYHSQNQLNGGEDSQDQAFHPRSCSCCSSSW